MEVKKNPKADLGKGSVLFFQIGLILVLGATYLMLEWKTYDKGEMDDFVVDMPDEVQEDIPITQLNSPPPPPPPPPPAMPETVEVVEDEIDVEEDLIQSTESSQDNMIGTVVAVSDVTYEEEEEEIENVPFAVVENLPLFPGCEEAEGREAQAKCMTEMIDAFVKREFNTGIGAELGLTGFHRIYVIFRINENGDAVDINARGPHIMLEQEATRVVKMLPRMEPGRQRDKPVSVVYSLPIRFEIRG